ncbi:hypothetical protein GGX14DRAFT_644466, partial [Mycena pura]
DTADIQESPPSRPLCPICDDPLPETPSEELQAMLDWVKTVSKPSPVPDCPDHHTPNRLSNVIIVCERHKLESDIFPLAIAEGWPFNPDFGGLHSRVTALR